MPFVIHFVDIEYCVPFLRSHSLSLSRARALSLSLSLARALSSIPDLTCASFQTSMGLLRASIVALYVGRTKLALEEEHAEMRMHPRLRTQV